MENEMYFQIQSSNLKISLFNIWLGLFNFEKKIENRKLKIIDNY